ncbi:MAG: hypothetical protein ND895_25455 [Pyrinomonadaceae bacterium]|nr:hypothetical protein [Pyrinomonadaceae bacterium]
MEIAGGDFKAALQTLRRVGLLLETDARLPSVATLIAGEPISGSWWSHASGQKIFAVLGQFEDHRDVMFTKLISGKVTLVHRKLWPEVLVIGAARAPWQMKGLSKSARLLLAMIDEQGSLRTDQLAWPKSRTAKPGEAARELEKKLLIHAGEFHTESGTHAKLLETWKTWAKRVSFPVGTIQVETAMEKMEERVRKLNVQFEAKARLPWL